MKYIKLTGYDNEYCIRREDIFGVRHGLYDFEFTVFVKGIHYGLQVDKASYELAKRILEDRLS